MKIVELRQEHLEPLSRFLAGLPDRDRTFAGDDVADPMILGTLATRPGRRWVAVADGDSQEITGFVSVHQHAGWSDHVASLRLVVHPDHRHGGVGTDLARRALAGSLSEGIRKIQIEIAADHESAIAMFAELGFSGEALLRDQIQGADGRYRDLVVLAHVVDDTWAAMDAVGLNEELQLLRGARSDRTDTVEASERRRGGAPTFSSAAAQQTLVVETDHTGTLPYTRIRARAGQVRPSTDTAGPDSPTATEKAIASDPDLTPTERAAVLNVYRGFRSRHSGGSA